MRFLNQLSRLTSQLSDKSHNCDEKKKQRWHKSFIIIPIRKQDYVKETSVVACDHKS